MVQARGPAGRGKLVDLFELDSGENTHDLDGELLYVYVGPYDELGSHERGARARMKALILTGGAGRSLVPFAATRPKVMTVVAGGSLMRRTLGHLREAGVTDVTVVLGQNGEKVKSVFKDGQDVGMHIAYVEQERPVGIADAILRARGRFIPGE